MKITIAGCNGRVGRRVVKAALERGHTVLGIDLVEPPFTGPGSKADSPWLESNASQFTFKRADLQDFDVVLGLLAGSDAVINLAACPNPGDYKVKAHNTNVVISWNILCACGELGINRVAQASSINVISMVYSKKTRYHYFPIDELHPCEPDEPYGLSKLIAETQADTITRRYDTMRVASLRLHWSISHKSIGNRISEGRAKDLWGYVQEDSGAQAFMLAIETGEERWSGHERFFIVSPQTAVDENTKNLLDRYWPNVPIKEGKTFVGTQGLFDCSKAGALLGWYHTDEPEQVLIHEKGISTIVNETIH